MIGIKEYNKKIVSLKNTRKMTKTMKMVSASKFKRAHKAQVNAEAYAQKLTGLMSRVSGGFVSHPLMKPKKSVTKVLLLVFTSDKGLCGGFNNNLIRKVRLWLAQDAYKNIDASISCCGRRGYMTLRRKAKVHKYYENITVKPAFLDAVTVATDITDAFIKGEFDEVHVAYNHFNSPLSQTPIIEKLLPLGSVATLGQAKPKSIDYIYEPEQNELFKFLIPKYLSFKVFFMLLENAAGEHGARMSAMDKASQNTADLIDRYILLRNRARQAAITTELIEIISGAEALK